MSEKYELSKPGLTTAVSYWQYSDAVQVCSMRDTDMNGLCMAWWKYSQLCRNGRLPRWGAISETASQSKCPTCVSKEGQCPLPPFHVAMHIQNDDLGVEKQEKSPRCGECESRAANLCQFHIWVHWHVLEIPCRRQTLRSSQERAKVSQEEIQLFGERTRV